MMNPFRKRGAKKTFRRRFKRKFIRKNRVARPIKKLGQPVKTFKFNVNCDLITQAVNSASGGVVISTYTGGLRIQVPAQGTASYGNSDTSYICVAWLHQIADISGNGTFLGMFDKYKFGGILSRVIANANVNSMFGPVLGTGGPSTSAPSITMCTFVDTNDLTTFAATDAEWNKIISWGRARLIPLPSKKNVDRFYKVRQLVPTYATAGGNNYMTLPAQWCDNSGATVTYPGLRQVFQIINQTPDVVSFNINMIFSYYMAFREFTGLG